MIVWIVESGVYEARYIAGIYSSAEKAMEVHPVRREGHGDDLGHPSTERCGGWKFEDGSWYNGLDWGDACQISPMTIDQVP